MKEKIKPIKKRIASVWAWMIVSPIRFFIVAIAIFFPLILSLDLFWFKDGDDFKNVLVEAHGLVFDLVVFGIILALYEHYRQLHENAKNEEREKQQRIERYKEEIDDFRGWDEKEAMYRIVGNIKRLNKEGETQMDLTNCNLCNANLRKANLSANPMVGANLAGADLTEAYLVGANLIGANLTGANLTDANLTGANLIGANLTGANLIRVKLTGAYLIKANLTSIEALNADFSKAYLAGANFTQASLNRVDLTGAEIINDFPLFSRAFLLPGENFLVPGGETSGKLHLTNSFLFNTILTDFKGLTFEILSKAYRMNDMIGIPEDILSRMEQEKPEIFDSVG